MSVSNLLYGEGSLEASSLDVLLPECIQHMSCSLTMYVMFTGWQLLKCNGYVSDMKYVQGLHAFLTELCNVTEFSHKYIECYVTCRILTQHPA